MNTSDDVATLFARYTEYEASFDKGEISSEMWRGVRGKLQDQIEELGGNVSELKRQEIDRRYREKMLRTTRLYAVEWLQKPEMLDWMAREFDNAEGDTETRLEAALVALRARVESS